MLAPSRPGGVVEQADSRAAVRQALKRPDMREFKTLSERRPPDAGEYPFEPEVGSGSPAP